MEKSLVSISTIKPCKIQAYYNVEKDPEFQAKKFFGIFIPFVLLLVSICFLESYTYLLKKLKGVNVYVCMCVYVCTYVRVYVRMHAFDFAEFPCFARKKTRMHENTGIKAKIPAGHGDKISSSPEI